MPFGKPVDHSERTAYNPKSEDPPYRFEHAFEHTSEGGSDVWIVINRHRAAGYPVATCETPEDAMMITDALNAREVR